MTVRPCESNCLKGLTKTRMANWTKENVKLHVNHFGKGIARVGLLAHKVGPLNNQAVLDAVAGAGAVGAAGAVDAHNGLVWSQNLTKTAMEFSTKQSGLKPVNSF